MHLRAALMVIEAEKSLVTADKIKFYSKAELFIFVNKLLAQDSNDLSFMVTYGNKLLAKSANKAQTIKDIIIEIDNHDLHVDARRVKKSIEAFKANVLDKKTEYYYAWNGLSYFLYEYNDSIKIQNAAPIQWYQLSNTSIEHVLPQTPTSHYWQTAFAQYTADEMRIITNSLGNLLLLSCGAENSSLRFPGKDMVTWLRAVMNTTDKIKVQAEMDIVIPHIDVNAEYTKANVMGLFKGITTKKEVVRYVFENTGIMLYAYLRGEEERREYLSGNIDINYFDYDDTHAKYSVGEIGNGMKYTIERASVVREIQAVEGSKLIFKKVLPLMGVEFVRHGMLTVVPFPFKYLREYAAKRDK